MSRADVSQEVKAAALRLVERRGSHAFTMDALAREMGIARATLYRRAGGRGAVLAALGRDGVQLAAQEDASERILAAARVVFSRAGFDAATLEEVAREAKVGTATVYRLFGDKDGLAQAFADRFGPRRAVREVAVRPSGNLRFDLEALATSVLRSAAAEGDLLKLALIERLRGGRFAQLLRASPLRSQKSLARFFKWYLARGALSPANPDLMAHAFSGLLLVFVARPFVDGSPAADPETTGRFIAQVFLDGLAGGKRRRR